MLFLPATNGKYEVGNKVTSAKNHNVSTFEIYYRWLIYFIGIIFFIQKMYFFKSICSHKLLHDTTTRVFKNMSHNMTHMTEGILTACLSIYINAFLILIEYIVCIYVDPIQYCKFRFDITENEVSRDSEPLQNTYIPCSQKKFWVSRL